EAQIRRGTFEIFGKRFELQSGSTIIFDPQDPELNPAVNIAAVYVVPGRRGVTVTVSVTGTLTSPELAFSSTETSDRAEIIALQIRRAPFESFGKRFELQSGSTIIFDPQDPELNPAVNIAAVYVVPGRRGVTVTVSVTGTLTSPELAFSSTETSDRAEIIAL